MSWNLILVFVVILLLYYVILACFRLIHRKHISITRHLTKKDLRVIAQISLVLTILPLLLLFIPPIGQKFGETFLRILLLPNVLVESYDVGSLTDGLSFFGSLIIMPLIVYFVFFLIIAIIFSIYRKNSGGQNSNGSVHKETSLLENSVNTTENMERGEARLEIRKSIKTPLIILGVFSVSAIVFFFIIFWTITVACQRVGGC